MFSWICPHCGRDNPPSAERCLNCGSRADDDDPAAEPAAAEHEHPEEQHNGAYGAEGPYEDEAYESEPEAEYEEFVEEPPPPPPPPPPSPPRRPPPPAARPVARPAGAPPARPATRPAAPPPPRPAVPTRPVVPPPRPVPRPAPARPAYVPPPPPTTRAGLPTWLLTVLSFLAIVGLGSAIYFGITYFGSGNKMKGSAAVEPAANAARAKATNPLQKSIEVVGIRLVENARKKPEVRFVVVNHANAPVDNLQATVTLWASTQRSEEDSIGSFDFKLPALGAMDSKELTEPLNTKLKFYELPDWQNATAEIEITSQ